ncbi:winged helix-turn-helix domain-containing protein [Robinsoniella sp. KNHs210]|uniref:winged helix-turn-helix domain-containing protein n=1 Tax=Robinsoniella sp. KNHs210 TaxID=1469950 RepID=UPI002101BB72|nr:helix-turn-helix domain-containing protein [Robinsoniella sp. KNHs210]
MKLTKKEYELLYTFFLNQGMILSREQLLSSVWGMDYYGDERTLDTHIRRLRNKIGEKYITTHIGIGYMLENQNE